MNNNLRLLAFLSLGLLLAALLGTFVIAAFARDEAPALGFGLAAGFLALVLAVISRRENIARVVLVIILALVMAGVSSIPIIKGVTARAVAREQANMERARQLDMRLKLKEEQQERSQSIRPVWRTNPAAPLEELQGGIKGHDSESPLPFFQIRLVLDEAAGDCDCDDMALVHTLGETGQHELLHVQHRVLLDQQAITSAAVVTNHPEAHFNIEITFSKEGSSKFAEITRDNVGKRLAIVIGGQLYCAPRIMTEVTDGKAVISARFNEREANTLVAKITESIPTK